jgi:hypothetical protein
MFDSIDTDGISQSLTPVLKELVHQAVNVKIATTSKSEFLVCVASILIKFRIIFLLKSRVCALFQLQMGNIPSNPFAMPALNASQMKSLVHRLLKQARPFVTVPPFTMHIWQILFL